ncbi:hypothetical protein MMC14_010554 [Varicellaria rhodocarpa]|nr:hypothetical protein [Varicellaria rhodocarpa]
MDNGIGQAHVNMSIDTAMFERMNLEDDAVSIPQSSPSEDGGVPLPQSKLLEDHRMNAPRLIDLLNQLKPDVKTMDSRKTKLTQPANRDHNHKSQGSNPSAARFQPQDPDRPASSYLPQDSSTFQPYESTRSAAVSSKLSHWRIDRIHRSTESLQLFQHSQTDRAAILPSVELVDQLHTFGPGNRPPPSPLHNTRSRRREKSSSSPAISAKLKLSFSPFSLPVPHPTNQYVVQAFPEPEKLSTPRSLLIILDLNGTLMDRRRNHLVLRPWLSDFLEYCLGNHTVMIWSSATPENVKSICERIFTPDQRKQVLREWGRDTLDLTTTEYYEKIQVYKRLDKIWDDATLQSNHPDANNLGCWSQADTVLIDDSVVKAQKQPFNHIKVPEFTRSPKKASEDDVLCQVMTYLEELRKWDDVSRFIKNDPFRVKQGLDVEFAEEQG